MKGYFRYYEEAVNNVWVPLASEVFGLNIYDCCDEYDIINPLVKNWSGFFSFNFAHFQYLKRIKLVGVYRYSYETKQYYCGIKDLING